MCYEVFDIGEDGKAFVRHDASTNFEEAQSAVIECPTNAIKIVETTNSSLRTRKKASKLSAIISLLIVLFIPIFYGVRFISLNLNPLKGDNYIASSKYNQFVSNIVEKHIDNNIFSIERDDTTNNTVTISYYFKENVPPEKYEEYAYNEIYYVYNEIKDIKIKREDLASPSGKDLIFTFYSTENRNKKQIGIVHILYVLGKLDADDYINKTTSIIKKS